MDGVFWLAKPAHCPQRPKQQGTGPVHTHLGRVLCSHSTTATLSFPCHSGQGFPTLPQGDVCWAQGSQSHPTSAGGRGEWVMLDSHITRGNSTSHLTAAARWKELRPYLCAKNIHAERLQFGGPSHFPGSLASHTATTKEKARQP